MSRDLQLRLHTIFTTATDMLGLPLDKQHVERLAVEAAPAVKAIVAEALDAAAKEAPVRYAVVEHQADEEGVETTEFAGCVSRIGVDVDHDSPAATLALQLRRQPEVTATDVPAAASLSLTIRPRSAQAWQWWLRKLSVDEDAVSMQGANAYAAGQVDGVAVRLCGEDTALLLDGGSSRSGLDIDLDTPAGTFAAKARRQPDVTALELVDAHTVGLTVRARSLVEWQWWLQQLSVAPGTVTFDGTTAVATGSKDGAIVHLHGDGAAVYYEDRVAARLMGLVATASP